jgi:hypothetical protein
MAVWLPRVIVFVARLQGRMDAEPLPAVLSSITPSGAQPWPLLRPQEVVRLIHLVIRWNVGIFNNGCFVRSMARYHFLRRMGTPVCLRLGVESRNPAETANHAAAGPFDHLRSHLWVVRSGQPYFEREPEKFESYRILLRYPVDAVSPAP